MRNVKLAVLVVVIFVMAAMFAAAATPVPTSAAQPPAQATVAATTAPAVTPKSGGTITMAIWQEPDNLNTELNQQTVAFHVADLFAEGLLSVNEKGQWFPQLATDVPTTANGGVSADGKTITYHLRKGVKWHDGTDFNCDDIVFTQKANTTANNGAVNSSQYSGVTVT
jgi:peptide/nickel transport system substrate-binding protein